MLSTQPILSSERIAVDIVEYLINTDFEKIKEILNNTLRDYQPEPEYEEPTGSKLYDFYSTLSTYVISTAQNTLYSYSRTRLKELTDAIRDINAENKLETIGEILGKPFSNFKSTSLNTLLLNAIMKNIDGYNPNAIIYGESLKEINQLAIEKIRELLNLQMAQKILEKRRDDRKKYETVKAELINKIQQLEMEKIKKEGEIFNNEIIFSKTSSDDTIIDDQSEKQTELNWELSRLINDYNTLVVDRDSLLKKISNEEKKYRDEMFVSRELMTELDNDDPIPSNESGDVGKLFESIFTSKWLEEEEFDNNKIKFPAFMLDFFDKIFSEAENTQIKSEIGKTRALKKQAFEISGNRDKTNDIPHRTSVFENLIKEDYQKSNSGIEINTNKKTNLKGCRSQLIFAYSPDYIQTLKNQENEIANVFADTAADIIRNENRPK